MTEREGGRERVLFSTIEQHKRKTITTIAWKVARKANQPIEAGDPLSYTPVTSSKTTKLCVVHSARNHVALSSITIKQQI